MKNGTDVAGASFSNQSDCSSNVPNIVGGNYLCLSTSTSLLPAQNSVFGQFNGNIVTLKQSIRVTSPGSITVNGNTASQGSQSGFNIEPHAIAVGGNVTGVGGNKLSNETNNASLGTDLNATNINNDITQDLTNGEKSGELVGSGNTVIGNSGATTQLYLNSPGNITTQGIPTTFSSPPEGKLWYVNGGLTINGPVQFNGLGTIVVSGNVTLDGNISCSPGSDFSIIATGTTGNISFGGNVGDIGCGAYVSEGNINLPQNPAPTQTWTGVFVAEGNVNLPTIDSQNITINYDSNIATNPPVLLRSILSLFPTSPS
jgi:hypothetical protein